MEKAARSAADPSYGTNSEFFFQMHWHLPHATGLAVCTTNAQSVPNAIHIFFGRLSCQGLSILLTILAAMSAPKRTVTHQSAGEQWHSQINGNQSNQNLWLFYLSYWCRLKSLMLWVTQRRKPLPSAYNSLRQKTMNVSSFARPPLFSHCFAPIFCRQKFALLSYDIEWWIYDTTLIKINENVKSDTKATGKKYGRDYKILVSLLVTKKIHKTKYPLFIIHRLTNTIN